MIGKACAALIGCFLSAVPASTEAAANPVQAAARLRVPILVYHNVAPLHPGETREQREFDIEPAMFEAEMRTIRDEGYTVISLRALVDALTGGSPVPARSVVITFDDGWQTQFAHAFPVLVRMGYTATFFVFTAPIGRRSEFMTWKELQEMQAAGMTIGSHSRTHPYLNKTPALKNELSGSRKDIERQIGTTPAFFAYPFGEKADSLKVAVRDAGYRAARGFGGGAWNSKENLLSLHSVPAPPGVASLRSLLRSVK